MTLMMIPSRRIIFLLCLIPPEIIDDIFSFNSLSKLPFKTEIKQFQF